MIMPVLSANSVPSRHLNLITTMLGQLWSDHFNVMGRNLRWHPLLILVQCYTAAGCKRSREIRDDCWHHSEGTVTGQETGAACKLARCGVERAGELAVEPEVEAGSKACEDDEVVAAMDPLDALGEDIFQCHILTLLEPQSLARCAAVCSRWRPLAIADQLWQPLVAAFLAQRAHLPLCLMDRDSTSVLSHHLRYTIAIADSRQQTLLSAEMCGRIWEMRLKPPVGPYWLGLDPSQLGKPGLNRYFSCDGSITADPGDPVWGGHGCVWEFVRLKGRDGGSTELVQVNHWPPLTPRRVKDGRWVLENLYGLYITRPDNPAFSSSEPCGASESKPLCRNSCKPPSYGFKI